MIQQHHVALRTHDSSKLQNHWITWSWVNIWLIWSNCAVVVGWTDRNHLFRRVFPKSKKLTHKQIYFCNDHMHTNHTWADNLSLQEPLKQQEHLLISVFNSKFRHNSPKLHQRAALVLNIKFLITATLLYFKQKQSQQAHLHHSIRFMSRSTKGQLIWS